MGPLLIPFTVSPLDDYRGTVSPRINHQSAVEHQFFKSSKKVEDDMDALMPTPMKRKQRKMKEKSDVVLAPGQVPVFKIINHGPGTLYMERLGTDQPHVVFHSITRSS